MGEWFTEKDFWERFYPLLFPPERLERGREEVAYIVSRTGCLEGRVLDLCCGPGRHAVEFARLGFAVTGVDLTPLLLQKGKELAQKEGLAVEWVQEDMRTFKRKNTYDLAVNLFTSFGFFEKKEDNQKVLFNLYESLKEGGTLFLDVMGKEILARRFQETRSCSLPDDSLFIEKNQVLESWSRIHNRWILIKEGKAREFQFNLWIYSAQELAAMLEEIGFVKLKIYGSHQGDAYDDEAKRLIIIGRKETGQ